MEDKKKIEAVLFTTGKFMTAEEIGKSSDIPDLSHVKNMLEELKKEYESKDSALTIQTHEDKYKLNIRKEYGHIANKLVSTAEMDTPTVKTLAIIAFKNPAMQSDVIKIRGNKAYDHITLLKEQGLITLEKHGRTRLIKLTPQFYDYFDTVAEEIKKKLGEVKMPENANTPQNDGKKQNEKPQENNRQQEQSI